MRNLINFLILYSVVILFLTLEIISLTLIVNNRGYQKSVFLSSSNKMIAGIYTMNNSVVEFFNLRTVNENLSEENTALKNEINTLRIELTQRQLNDTTTDSLNFFIPAESDYKLISAKVINSSTNKLKNYITLNKGARDSVKVDMGVVNHEGIIGIVKTVSEKFSVVIPVLNDDIKFSCKLKKTNYNGSLEWSGQDYRFAKLKDIARHVKFSEGDTIITTGFTRSFPEGIIVGTIDKFSLKKGDAYYDINVRLAVNFRALSHVKVIDYKNYNEQRLLEQAASTKKEEK